MTQPLSTLRLDLAQAKADLRIAKDAYEVARAVAELAAAERLGANLGRNADERARNLTVELLHDDNHTEALAHLRECERQVDLIHAQVAVEEDAIRAAELAARERLSQALMGKRADDAGADAAVDEMHRQQLGYYDARRQPNDWYIDTDPVFPAGSNAGGEYPR
jgi:hypothetical protein